MAIKLSGSISRKVPIEGVQFSSQQFGGSLEVEVNSEDPTVIREKLHHLYESLSTAIDAEIAASQTNAGPQQRPTLPQRNQSAPTQPQNDQQARNGYASTRNRLPSTQNNGNGNGNGRRVNATDAQCRAIYAICKSQGLDMVGVLADYNVGDARDLHVKDASRLIDELKAKQPANGDGH